MTEEETISPIKEWYNRHLEYKNPPRYPDEDICDWCGMNYPKGTWDCYYEVRVFGRDHHVICSDCYEHLTKVKSK
jgi:hypothetical protein